MAFKIGFATEQRTEEEVKVYTECSRLVTARRSIVDVSFPGCGTALTYYNDLFDLHRGDIVFVEGKLDGVRGRVIDVNYNFKIKLSDYKRVVAVADTDVRGRFFMAGSHFITFDRAALPIKKAASWYFASDREKDEFISCYDDSSYTIDDLKSLGTSDAVAERGQEYYMENKVVYFCLDGGRGYAIVEGTKPYEIEFDYNGGEISRLVCSCYCSHNCKHEIAVLLQLRETMLLIERQYPSEYEKSGYFAAVEKGVLFSASVDGKSNGSFTL